MQSGGITKTIHWYEYRAAEKNAMILKNIFQADERKNLEVLSLWKTKQERIIWCCNQTITHRIF